MIITSSSNEKLEFAKQLGAKYLINYKETPDWDEKVMEIVSDPNILDIDPQTFEDWQSGCRPHH